MSTITEQVLDQINARPAEERKRSGELGQEDFLELMIAQVRHQDPFSPMENGEFIAQMAQFATVDGIQEMQRSIGALNTTMSSQQVLEASALVGRSVLAEANELDIDSGERVTGAFETDPSAINLVMRVEDAVGALVARRELQPSPSGLTRFEFDGRGDDGSALPAGTYRFSAEALVNGKGEAARTLLGQEIESVTIGATADAMRLNLGRGVSLPLADVTEFR